MEPKVKKLSHADYRTSRWSGGTTTQLLIFPPEAEYADRDFLWRVSSAAVELEASDFTPLPDYLRLICTLRGSIALSHNGAEGVSLQPYQVHAFSGADRTRSEGRCTDFNLMLRRGSASGEIRVLQVSETPAAELDPSSDQILVYCAEGSCTLHFMEKTESLQAGESLLISPCGGLLPDPVLETGTAAPCTTLIICQMRRI